MYSTRLFKVPKLWLVRLEQIQFNLEKVVMNLLPVGRPYFDMTKTSYHWNSHKHLFTIQFISLLFHWKWCQIIKLWLINNDLNPPSLWQLASKYLTFCEVNKLSIPILNVDI